MLKRQTLTGQVVEYLLQLIKTQQAKPGDKLPTEMELTVRLGVSRTCVREAMKSLESLGMVSIRPRVGAILVQPQRRAFLSAEHFAGDDGRHSDYLLELRKIVEVGVAALAAEKADDADVLNLQRALEAYVQEFRSGAVSVNTDMEFHKVLVIATKNPLLVATYEVMLPHFETALKEVADLPGERESTIREHSRILKAIARKDPKRAETAMRAHLATVERYRRVVAAQQSAVINLPADVTVLEEAPEP